MFKLQSLFILQKDAQGFNSVDHFRNEIFYNFSLSAPWVLVQKGVNLPMTKPTGIQKKKKKCLR